MLDCVVFDMDGTLLDTERISVIAWQTAGREMGIEIPKDFITGYFGMNRTAIDELYRQTYGPDFPIDALRARRVQLGEEFFQREPVHPKPGARELLIYLADRGIPALLATGTEYVKARQELEETGLWEYLQGSICGSMVTRCKPDPEIYQRAMALTGAIPGRTLVVEDSQNGIKAGIAAGCKTVLIPDTWTPTGDFDGKLYACLDTLLELIPIVDKLGLKEEKTK